MLSFDVEKTMLPTGPLKSPPLDDDAGSPLQPVKTPQSPPTDQQAKHLETLPKW